MWVEIRKKFYAFLMHYKPKNYVLAIGRKVKKHFQQKNLFKVLTFKISPGAKTSIHVHPLNGAGYILSGELTMYSTEDTHGSFANPKQVKKIILKAGGAWTET